MNFEQFDKVLEFGPDKLGFRVLMGYLEQSPEDGQKAIFEYLDTQLESWPDEERTAPWSWLTALAMEKKGLLKWKLARTIDANHPVLWGWSPSSLPEDTTAFENITSIKLSAGQEFTKYIFNNGELFPALRRLKTDGAGNVGSGNDINGMGSLSNTILIEQIKCAQFGDEGSCTYTLGEPNYFELLYNDSPQYIAKNLKSLSIRAHVLDDFIGFLNSNTFPSLQELCITFERWAKWKDETDCIAPTSDTVDFLNGLEKLSVLNVDSNFVGGFFDFYSIQPKSLCVDIVNAEPDIIASSSVMGAITELSMTGQSEMNKLITAKIVKLELSDLTKPIAGGDLSSIETLGLTAGYHDTDAVVDTIKARSLTNLRHLTIDGASGGGTKYDGDQVLSAIVSSGILKCLASLSMSGGWGRHDLSPDVLKTFSMAEKPKLEHLFLRFSSMGDAGAATFCKGSFPKLKSLSLIGADLTDKGFASMFATSFPALRELNLNYNKVTRMAIENNGHTNTPFLRSIDLSRNPIGETTDKVTWHTALIEQLWSLKLVDCDINDRTAVELFEREYSNLVNLEIWNNDRYGDQDDDEDILIPSIFSQQTAEAIANSKGMANLDTLLAGVYQDDFDHGSGSNWISEYPFCEQDKNIISQSSVLRKSSIASIVNNVRLGNATAGLEYLPGDLRMALKKAQTDYDLDLECIDVLIEEGEVVSLNLQDCWLKNIDFLAALPSLEILDVSCNSLECISPEIGGLTNLTRLDVSFNNLENLPSEIWQLKQLSDLNLSSNNLTNIPAEIGQLAELTDLNLRNNMLMRFPAEIKQCQYLYSIDLSGNKLISLPPEIGLFDSLTFIYLSDNQLTSVPVEIAQLALLSHLDLSKNQLTSLPPEIGQLTNLEQLILNGNQLTSLPVEIGQLIQLTKLIIDDHNIKDVPPVLLHLVQKDTQG